MRLLKKRSRRSRNYGRTKNQEPRSKIQRIRTKKKERNKGRSKKKNKKTYSNVVCVVPFLILFFSLSLVLLFLFPPIALPYLGSWILVLGSSSYFPECYNVIN
jgi:glucan phosphoethanolaminetransferase (alkaline phosphatase superfamily)